MARGAVDVTIPGIVTKHAKQHTGGTILPFVQYTNPSSRKPRRLKSVNCYAKRQSNRQSNQNFTYIFIFYIHTYIHTFLHTFYIHIYIIYIIYIYLIYYIPRTSDIYFMYTRILHNVYLRYTCLPLLTPPPMSTVPSAGSADDSSVQIPGHVRCPLSGLWVKTIKTKKRRRSISAEVNTTAPVFPSLNPWNVHAEVNTTTLVNSLNFIANPKGEVPYNAEGDDRDCPGKDYSGYFIPNSKGIPPIGAPVFDKPIPSLNPWNNHLCAWNCELSTSTSLITTRCCDENYVHKICGFKEGGCPVCSPPDESPLPPESPLPECEPEFDVEEVPESPLPTNSPLLPEMEPGFISEFDVEEVY
jgi:hypothetical protein